ncbi:Paired amphipathic helix protein Sin3a [Homalodisca vitripennis]|nr:Paired amphipathic helix protein Sin3a [Homalodisca vitripennis]
MKAHSRGGAGGLCATANTRAHAEAAYQRKAELALADENCFKMFIYKVDCKITIELLDSEGDENEVPTREVEKWSAYVDRYSKSSNKEKDETMDIDEDGETEQDRRLFGKAIFLPRNVRLWHERVGNNKSNMPKIDSCDDTECKFNLNSYKMVFVLDRESYLYKRQALLRARKEGPVGDDASGSNHVRPVFVCRQVPGLGYATRLGFSVNKQCIVENLKEESLVALRKVCDGISAAGGLKAMEITNELVHAAKNSHAHYSEHLAKQREEMKDKINSEKERKQAAIEKKELEAQKFQVLSDARKRAAELDDKIQELSKKCKS